MANIASAATKVRPGKEPGRPYADLWARPGYLARRMHQIHVGLFAEECRDFDITPIQFAILTVLYSGRALDQITLSTAVGIDRTSGADIIKRLCRRGLVERVSSTEDRRARLAHITGEGQALVRRMQPHMERAQERLISPLSPAEQAMFNELIGKIIQANNDASRAPIAIDF
ncbi:MAG TPA: MarR family transcriptional regulator [Roseiarcus sp.]|nr:MarR family transcriptional regulator [Roseiarcus sp.]